MAIGLLFEVGILNLRISPAADIFKIPFPINSVPHIPPSVPADKK